MRWFYGVLICLYLVKGYEIEQLPNSAGLIIEKGADVRLVSGHYKLIFFVSIAEMENVKNGIEYRLKALQEKCDSAPHTRIFSNQITPLWDELKSINETQKDTYRLLRPKIYKRTAPFAFLSDLHKSLYGTLNEDDREEIEDRINENTEKIRNVSEIVKDQTVIIQDQFKNINETASKMIKLHSETVQHINIIQNMTMDNTRQILELKEAIKIITAIGTTKSYLDNIRSDYEALFDAVLHAKSGKIHPRVMTIQRIADTATKYFFQKKTERYPIDDLTSYDDFLRLSTLNIYLNNGKLLYYILIPFTNNNMYSLYNVIPEFANLTVGCGYTRPE